MKTNREKALELLSQADEHAADPMDIALTGIGWAMLEVADALRDRTAEIVAGLRS